MPVQIQQEGVKMWRKVPGFAVFLTLAVAATAVVSAQPQRPQFGNFRFEAGTQPRGIEVNDFNGDGLMDLVTAQGECPTVAISFGTTDDYLMPAELVGSGCHGEDVTLGDFNEDGTPDLASTTEPGEVKVYLGTGGGSFAPANVYTVAQLMLSIVAGDFNGDNHDDVVTVSINPPQNIWLLPGNGDGTLGAPTAIFPGYFRIVVSGHLNGDTHLDLLATDGLSDDSLLVFLADGAGGFNSPVSYAAGGGVVVVDVDDDGDADLATTLPAGQISVLEGNGDGSFQTPVGYPTQGGSPQRITAEDLNADGVPDLVAAGDGYVSLLLGAGDGSFGAAFTTDGPGFGWDVEVTDLDGDSIPDVVATDSFSLLVFPGNGDGTLLNRVLHFDWESSDGSFAAKLDDLDLDGRPDLVVVDDDPAGVYPLYGNPDGSFEFGLSVTSLDGLVDAAVGEFGVNATPDLAILADRSGPPGPAPKSLWILFSLGPRTFAPVKVEGPPVSFNPSSLTPADLNGDGKTDLLVTDEGTDEVIVMIGLGNGQFAAPFPTYAVGDAPVAAFVGRLDGDQHLDLVVVNRDSDDVAVLLGIGDGSFQPASFVGTGSAPVSVELGDLNDDGNLDLVVPNLPTSLPKDVTVRLGNGDGTFGSDLRLATGSYAEGVALGDFDRDGLVDLAIRGVTLFRGNGDGTFELGSRHTGGGRSLFVSDVDQDGWLDLIAGGRVLLNQGGPGMVGFESDRETLRWPGVLGADSYNLYRGDTASFVDGNSDGLSDGGYGVCLSASDPDPTDTVFTDSDVPTTGGDGFFYLRAVVLGVDEDLGETSSGLERLATSPCP